MVNQHETMSEECQLSQDSAAIGSRGTRKRLQYELKLFKALQLRSQALGDRLQNEINLVRLVVPYQEYLLTRNKRHSTPLLSAIVKLQFVLEKLHREIALL